MLARTKFFLLILVLNYPPSLLLPLPQQQDVLGNIENEQLTPKNVNLPEIIQQIDVKDKENKVISNINPVAISKESNDNIVTSKENTNSIVTKATSLNTNSYFNLKERINLASVSTTLTPLDGENILHITEPVITWRSEVPVKRKSKNQNKLYYIINYIINASKNNSEGIVENTDSDLLDSNHNLPVDQNDEENIFVLLNSGNIDGLSVNSPVNNDNLPTNSDNNIIKNIGSINSKIMNDLVNITLNNVLSKILQKDHTILNTKHTFLLLNSGSIKNIHVSSSVLENIAKTLNDRSRRHLNDTYTNNSTVEYITLKPPDNTTDVNYKNTDEIPVEEISSAEAAAFRSLKTDKIKQLQQVKNTISTTIEPNTTEDHNLIIKLSPEGPPITIDLDQLPFNNILGGALNLMKRFKRNTLEEDTNPLTIDCKELHIGNHTEKSCKKAKSNSDLSYTPSRKSLVDSISNVLNIYDTVELKCPLAVIVKLFTNQVIDKLTKNDTNGELNKILSSFLKGNEDITVATKELLEVPIPVKLRLQLVLGKTSEFMEMLSNTIDATLCSLI